MSVPDAALSGEVISPTDPVIQTTRAQSTWTLGEREHALLVHDADKHEARFYTAMKAFIITAVVDVAVNGGLPVAQALLQRYDLPLLNDGMLSGVCGLAAIVFACAMIYFYAGYHNCTLQLHFNIETPTHVRHNWAKWIVLTLGSGGFRSRQLGGVLLDRR